MLSTLLAFLIEANEWLNAFWGPPFMLLLVGTGLYLTLRRRFFQLTHLGEATFPQGCDTRSDHPPPPPRNLW